MFGDRDKMIATFVKDVDAAKAKPSANPASPRTVRASVMTTALHKLADNLEAEHQSRRAEEDAALGQFRKDIKDIVTACV